MKSIRIGTLVNGGSAAKVIPQLIPHGFESFGLTFWQSTNGADLFEIAKRVREQTEPHDIVISSVGVFGNPLTGAGDNADTLASWERLIDAAEAFGTNVVAGFTGRMPGRIDESMARWRCPRGYVEDVAAAMALTVVDERAVGRVFNVAEAAAFTEAEWVRRLGEVVGWPGEVVTVPILIFSIILVITSVALALFVLMHKGRGGGLSDLFGGGISSSLGGSSVAERNLDRLTVIIGVVWLAAIVALNLLYKLGA